MSPQTAIFIGGAYHVAAAVFHIFFWKIFGWREDLAKLSFANRQIMQVLNLCAIFVFLAVAIVSFNMPKDLYENDHLIFILIAAFWTFRAILQPIFFGLRHKASLALFCVFLAGAALYSYICVLTRPVIVY